MSSSNRPPPSTQPGAPEFAEGSAPTLIPSGARLTAAEGDETTAVSPRLLLGDRYEVQRELGRGGMGRVLVAFDRRLGRTVAIKELLTPDPAARERFEREMQVTARLQHPSIVTIHEAGVGPQGEPFYVMPQVPGHTLDEAIHAARDLPQRLALLPQVIGACEAMAYAHQHQVIHRDLKPANILVGAFGETVVIDWGLAKPLDAAELPTDRAPIGSTGATSDAAHVALTQVGFAVGTPDYMSPEQAQGATVDARTDVYALGVILWRLLVGRTPYQGSTAGEIMQAVVSGPPPEADWAGVPVDLVAIVRRAMAYRPADRYPTARELVADLRRFQAGQRVDAHQYSLGELVARWVRRHRSMLALGTAAGVALLGVGLVSLARVLESRRVAERERAAAVVARDQARQLQHQAELDRQTSLLRDARVEVGIDPTGTLGLLGQLSPSLPGWPEARFIAEEALSTDVARWALHLPGVTQVGFLNHSPRLALGTKAGAVIVWDPRDRSALALGNPGAPISELTLSDDDRLLAAAGQDGSARVWDVETHSPLAATPPGAPLTSIGFLRDGSLALMRSGPVLEIRDPQTGQMREQVSGTQLGQVAARANAVTLYRSETELEIYDAAHHHQTVAVDPIGRVRLEPDGRTLIGWSNAEGSIAIDVASGTHTALAGLGTHVTNSAALLSTGEAVTTLDQRTYAVWDTLSAKAPRHGQLDCDAVDVFPLSPPHTALFFCADAVELVDVATGLRRLIAHPGGSSTRVAYDARHLAARVDDSTVWVWDLERAPHPEVNAGHPVDVLLAAPAADRLLAVGGGQASSITEIDLAALQAHAVLRVDGELQLTALSRDGSAIAWSRSDGDAIAWQGRSDRTPRQVSLPSARALSFSPDAHELVVADGSGVDLIDVTRGSVTHLAADGATTDAVESPDGAWVISTDAVTHRLTAWSRTGALLHRLDEATSRQTSLSPSGRWFAMGQDSGDVDLWSTATWSRRTLRGAAPGVGALTILPDESAVILADRTATLWSRPLDGTPERQIARLPVGAASVLPSSDSKRVATFDGSGDAAVIDVASGAVWHLHDSRGLFDDIAAWDHPAAWITARGKEVRLWRDDLPADPAAILERLRAIPEPIPLDPH